MGRVCKGMGTSAWSKYPQEFRKNVIDYNVQKARGNPLLPKPLVAQSPNPLLPKDTLPQRLLVEAGDGPSRWAWALKRDIMAEPFWPSLVSFVVLTSPSHSGSTSLTRNLLLTPGAVASPRAAR